MATYGREGEVFEFLVSIKNSQYDLNQIQIIIVDQNDKFNLSNVIESFPTLNIVHIKSKVRGLSFNRNLGLRYAEGEIIAFPDDDCEYYELTLQKIDTAFSKYKEYDLILGRIIDKDGKNVIRRWPSLKLRVNRFNFYDKYSSITMFFKRDFICEMNFSNQLGAGTFYGSCEDTDIVYRSLLNGKVLYSPNIEVYHPEMNTEVMDKRKVNSYGLGFGAFVRKNIDFFLAILFLKVLVFHMIKLIQSLIMLDKNELEKRYLAIVSRCKGFCMYNLKNKGF